MSSMNSKLQATRLKTRLLREVWFPRTPLPRFLASLWVDSRILGGGGSFNTCSCCPQGANVKRKLSPVCRGTPFGNPRQCWEGGVNVGGGGGGGRAANVKYEFEAPSNQTQNQTSERSLVFLHTTPTFSGFPFHFPFRGRKGSDPAGLGCVEVGPHGTQPAHYRQDRAGALHVSGYPYDAPTPT